MNVRKIDFTEPDPHKRVAAYARVSTLRECQEDSFETQVKYYETLIASTPQWELAKIYADRGFSGVSAEKRPGFMEMIRDAEQKAFDILLVRSVSRFARNVKEAWEYCRKLKIWGIEIRFEKERISGNDPIAEPIFQLLASCAQEESRTVSERTKWSIHKLQEQGIYHMGNGRILGYDERDGKLLPNADAWIVQALFCHYADGDSIQTIQEALSACGYHTTRASIGRMLRNVVYVGDRVLQKQAPKHYLTHKPDPTQPYQSHYIPDAHEALISRELWNKAQARLSETARMASVGVRRRRDSHMLYGKLFCGICGHPMKRKIIFSGDEKTAVWKCADRLQGKRGSGCQNGTIKELDLLCLLADIEEDLPCAIDCIIEGKELKLLPRPPLVSAHNSNLSS